MTLLELMVTLVILGGLVVMISQIYGQTVRSRDMVIGNLDVVDRAQSVIDLMVSDLEAMHTFDSRAYLFVDVVPFRETEGTAIAFPTSSRVRVSEEQREVAGLMEVAYLVSEDPDHQGLLRVFRRELEIETDPNATAIRGSSDGLTLLVDGLKEFRMEFLSADALEDLPKGTEPEYVKEWQPGWGPEALPVAIRVIITVNDPKGAGKPLTLMRTVRLATGVVDTETLQEPLKKELGIEVEASAP